MKEQEFDIYVRNLLQNAEESVSPKVWEGVEAGLRRKKLIPLWRRVALSAAAAAAVVVAFVLLRPAAPSEENHSQPTSSIFMTGDPSRVAQVLPEAPIPVETPETVQEPVKTPSARPSSPVSVKEVSSFSEASASETPAEEEVPVVEPSHPVEVPQASEPKEPQAASAETVTSTQMPKASLEDQALLAQLASHPQKRQGGFSFTASADLQSKSRREFGTASMPRQYGLPPSIDERKEGIYNASPETHFTMPVSAGVGLTYHFTPRWALGMGVRYTFMGRTFIGDYVSGDGYAITETDINNNQHWMGIPVNIYFNFVNQGRWIVHAFAGGAAEFLLRNDYLVHNATKDIHFMEPALRPQWSVQLGVGVEFRLAPAVSLYLDPKLDYYFGTQNQPRSLRTIQPLRFDVEAGLRFNLGKQQR